MALLTSGFDGLAAFYSTKLLLVPVKRLGGLKRNIHLLFIRWSMNEAEHQGVTEVTMMAAQIFSLSLHYLFISFFCVFCR